MAARHYPTVRKVLGRNIQKLRLPAIVVSEKRRGQPTNHTKQSEQLVIKTKTHLSTTTKGKYIGLSPI